MWIGSSPTPAWSQQPPATTCYTTPANGTGTSVVSCCIVEEYGADKMNYFLFLPLSSRDEVRTAHCLWQ